MPRKTEKDFPYPVGSDTKISFPEINASECLYSTFLAWLNSLVERLLNKSLQKSLSYHIHVHNIVKKYTITTNRFV